MPGASDRAERLPTLLSLERVLLVDQLPRQFATLFTQLIAKAGELLFFGQMLLSGRYPLVARHYLVSSHLVLLGPIPRVAPVIKTVISATFIAFSPFGYCVLVGGREMNLAPGIEQWE